MEGKGLEKIILNGLLRNTVGVDGGLSSNQLGFRKVRTTIDDILSLTEIFEMQALEDGCSLLCIMSIWQLFPKRSLV